MTTNAILAEVEAEVRAMPRTPQATPKRVEACKPRRTIDLIDAQIDARRWRAILDRDRSLDGAFVFAVSSTGVFCRPSCPAKHARRENVSFFDNALQAEQAGFRACLRCRPKAVDGNPQSTLVRAMCRYIEQHLEDRVTLSQLAREFR